MNYVYDENGNKIEGLSKQEVYAALQQAIDDGDLQNIDTQTAFVSKVKCCIGGGTFQLAFVTNAVYLQLEADQQLENNTIYVITDDETEQNIEDAIAVLQNDTSAIYTSVNDITTGVTKINLKDNSNASQELNMTTGVLKVGTEIIGRKKVLFSGYDSTGTITLSEAMSSGDKFKIIAENREFTCIVNSDGVNDIVLDGVNVIFNDHCTMQNRTFRISYTAGQTTMTFGKIIKLMLAIDTATIGATASMSLANKNDANYPKIREVSKIIE